MIYKRIFTSVFRWKSFDNSTVQGRSKERYRRIALTALSSGGVRCINIMTSLISVPLTMEYLGAERYGLWLTISSVIALLSFADLGIGNGLINAISKANGKNDRDMAKQYVSSAFFMLTMIAIIIGLCFAMVYSLIPWKNIFNTSSSIAIAEAGPAMAVFVCCFLTNLPLGIVQRIQMGYQEGFVNNIWQGIGSLLGLASLLSAIYMKANLPVLVLAMAGTPAIISGLNGISLFCYRKSWLYPEWRSVDISKIRYILKNGILFFTLQIAGTIAFQTDNILISYFMGTDHVPQYAVPMMLFMIIPTIFSFILTPLWPAYSESISRGEMIWVYRTFVRSIKISFIIALPSAFFMVLFCNKIIHLWVGSTISPSFPLLIGFGVWVVINALSGSIAMLLNGINIIRFQVITSLLMGFSNLAISFILVQRIGIAGPIYGSIIAVTIFSILPSSVYIRRLFVSWQKSSSSEDYKKLPDSSVI